MKFTQNNFYIRQKLAYLMLAFLILFSFIGLHPFTIDSGLEFDLSDTGGGNLIRQLVFLSSFLFTVFYIYKENFFRKILQLCPLLTMLLLLCVFSIFWAEHPAISFRRTVLLIITTITIFCLISILTIEEIVCCLSRVMVFLILSSLVGVLIFSGSVHQSAELFDTGLEGNWKGIFIHKNHAGPALVISIALFIYKFHISKNYFWVFMVFLATVFLIFTKSKSSISLLIPSLIMGYILFKTLRSIIIQRVIVILFLTLLLLISISYIEILEFFESILENPEALTGRSTIWALLTRAISDNFILGLGYGSVWSVGEDMLLAEYAIGWVDWVFLLTHAHSGYLEVFISLGFIGFVLAILTFFIMPFFKAISVSASSVHPFMFIFFTGYFFFLFHNLIETDLLNSSDGRWFLMLILYFSLYLKFNSSQKNEKQKYL